MVPWFREEVERELDYQTRRLRNHTCLALWCGNSENHWGFHEWWRGEPPVFGGAECYNRNAPGSRFIFPAALGREDYGGGRRKINDVTFYERFM